MGRTMRRLILVANRLPVSLDLSDGQVNVQDSSGGLATGMRGLAKQAQTSWIGWPGGMPSNDEQRAQLDRKLAEHSATPVYLSTQEAERFTRVCRTASFGRYFTTWSTDFRCSSVTTTSTARQSAFRRHRVRASDRG